MVGERTSDVVIEKNFERVRQFGAMSVEFPIVREFSVEGYDYLDFEIDYSANYDGPESYKGFSGAGLWQIVVGREPNGTLKVLETLLSGVAFYQSPIQDGKRIIRCHGRQSIYRNAVEAAASF